MNQLLLRSVEQLSDLFRRVHLVRLEFDPCGWHLVSKPGFLSFGKLPGAGFDVLDGGFECDGSLQVLDDLAVADGLHGGQGPVVFVFVHQLPGFFYQACFDHVVHATIYAFSQVVSVSGERENLGLRWILCLMVCCSIV